MPTHLLEDLRLAAWTIWHRRRLALAIAWGVCLIGWAIVFFIPNSYAAHARIFVQLDDVLAQQIGIGAGSREKNIDRVRQTLTSSVNLERVVRLTRIGDTVTTASEMEQAVEALAKDVTIVATGDNLFEITAISGRRSLSDAENARLAQDVAQRLIDIFRDENLGGSRGEMRETLAFLDQQLATRQQALEAAEQRRLVFEAANPELIGGASAIASSLSAARSELRSVQADYAAARSALAALDGQMADTPRRVDAAEPDGAQAMLATAEANLGTLLARGLTEAHPDVGILRRQIRGLQQQVEREGNRTGEGSGPVNPAYSSLSALRAERVASVQSLQARAAALQSEIGNITLAQTQEPGAAAEAQRISRDYKVLQEQYDKLLQDREELRLRGQVETERNAIKFEVIDPPTPPRSPHSPNRPLWLGVVLLAGLAAGSGAAYGLGRFDQGFATAARMEERMGIPVAASITLFLNASGRAARARHIRRLAANLIGLGGVFAVLMATELLTRGGTI